MGQNVNYLLGNQSQLMGADPEQYRQQLIQAEQARISGMPVQNQVGAQLGSLLGRGLTNIAQDRGFFEVTNPVLQKLQKIQSVYDTSMQQADPNDPMSFYTTLQKNFADAGLGQQAMMAQVEAKKFEASDLKTEAAKTELYKKNPSLLDTQIAKARDVGDDKLANQLADQRGKIQVQIDLDRAKEIADINYKNAATQAQKAQAGKLSQEIESGKFDWKVINDVTGAPTHMAKINKKTGETVYEPITLPGGVVSTPGATAPAKGERRPLGEVLSTQPAAAPAAQPVAAPAPVAPGQAANSNTPNPLAPNGEYRAAYDPVFLGIQQAIQQDPARLAADPEFMAAITKARNDRVSLLREKYGNMVNFTGVL